MSSTRPTAATDCFSQRAIRSSSSAPEPQSEVRLYTHLATREDTHLLFGFLDRDRAPLVPGLEQGQRRPLGGQRLDDRQTIESGQHAVDGHKTPILVLSPLAQVDDRGARAARSRVLSGTSRGI